MSKSWILGGALAFVAACPGDKIEGGNPAAGNVTCDGYEDEPSGADECVPYIVMTAADACSGSVAGNRTSCFVFTPSSILDPSAHPALGTFICDPPLDGQGVALDPCTQPPNTEYCRAPVFDALFEAPEEASGIGTPEDICEAAAGGQAWTATRPTGQTVWDYAFEISAAVDPPQANVGCDGFLLRTVVAECALPGASFEGGDTGFDAMHQASFVDAYQPDMIFWINPATSEFRLRGAAGNWDAAPVAGELLAAESPARFLVGAAHGGAITVDGYTWSNPWATFNTPVLVDVLGGNFKIPPAQSDAVVWTATSPAGVRESFDVSPKQLVTGSFNVSAGTWSMVYAQNLPNGRRFELSTSGYLQSIP
jgi:hypothetical protein